MIIRIRRLSAGVLSLLGSLSLLFSISVVASDGDRAERATRGISNQQLIVDSPAYLAGHPDQRWRREGMAAYREGRHADAQRHFLRAARYADKPSQAIIAKGYWTGELGLPVNRVLGYIWMDLAAERGYRDFLAQRERYWAQLNEREREQVAALGPPLHGEYADQAAKPRHRVQMIRSRMVSARSRTELDGFKTVVLYGDTAGQRHRVFGHQFYDEAHWNPEIYWDTQDDLWHAPPKGRIDILPLRPLTAQELP